MPKDKVKVGYAIEVSGQYHALNPETGAKSPKVFPPEKFVFPEIVDYKDGMKEVMVTLEDGSERKTYEPNVVRAHILNVALHLIRTYHIGPRLREKYADYNGIRLCSIFSKEEIELSDKESTAIMDKKIKDMSESDLLQYVTISDTPVILSNYADLGDMKAAVQQAVDQKVQDDVAAGKARPLTSEEKLLQKPSLLS